MKRIFHAAKSPVYNRGSAPDSFLNELIDCFKKLLKDSPEVFARNEKYDIFSSISSELGPWTTDLVHRAAGLAEAMRCLGGYESTWNWLEGKDLSAGPERPEEEEAGLFQCSANSMSFSPSLKALLSKHANGDISVASFIKTSKLDHEFCLEYCARLLRETVNHHGPVKRKEINTWLRRDSMAELEHFLKEDGIVITLPPQPPETLPDLIPWLTTARKYLGEHEISPGNNKFILDCFKYTSYGPAENDEIHWCAAFICRCLSENKYAHTHSALANSFSNYGTPCGLVPGAIVVFKWASGHRHVTILDHVESSTTVSCLGGNQSNSVKYSIYEKKYIQSVRWPVKL